MGRRIIIEEEGNVQPQALPVSSRPRLDLQDGLLLAGIGLWEAAAAAIWWPLALILGGAFCLGFAWMIERSGPKGKHGSVKP